jgi:hypothetical protein
MCKADCGNSTAYYFEDEKLLQYSEDVTLSV